MNILSVAAGMFKGLFSSSSSSSSGTGSGPVLHVSNHGSSGTGPPYSQLPGGINIVNYPANWYVPHDEAGAIVTQMGAMAVSNPSEFKRIMNELNGLSFDLELKELLK